MVLLCPRERNLMIYSMKSSKSIKAILTGKKNQKEQSQAGDDEETHEEEDPLVRASKGYQLQ